MGRQHLIAPSPAVRSWKRWRRSTDPVAGGSARDVAVGQRVRGCGPEQIREALWDDRTLVKTWADEGHAALAPAGGGAALLQRAVDLRSARMFGGWSGRRHSIAVERFAERTCAALDGKAMTRRRSHAEGDPEVSVSGGEPIPSVELGDGADGASVLDGAGRLLGRRAAASTRRSVRRDQCSSATTCGSVRGTQRALSDATRGVGPAHDAETTSRMGTSCEPDMRTTELHEPELRRSQLTQDALALPRRPSGS
jgi:hypothetical protein